MWLIVWCSESIGGVKYIMFKTLAVASCAWSSEILYITASSSMHRGFMLDVQTNGLGSANGLGRKFGRKFLQVAKFAITQLYLIRALLNMAHILEGKKNTRYLIPFQNISREAYKIYGGNELQQLHFSWLSFWTPFGLWVLILWPSYSKLLQTKKGRRKYWYALGESPWSVSMINTILKHKKVSLHSTRSQILLQQMCIIPEWSLLLNVNAVPTQETLKILLFNLFSSKYLKPTMKKHSQLNWDVFVLDKGALRSWNCFLWNLFRSSEKNNVKDRTFLKKICT